MLTYDGVALDLFVKKTITLTSTETNIRVKEISQLSQTDRSYAMTVRHPTRGLRLTFRLNLDNWQVKNSLVSGSYLAEDKKNVVKQPDSTKTVHIHVPGWTLPGIALYLEFSPA